MAGEWPAKSLGDNPSSVLEAYPADIDQGMQAKGPLVSIPFIDNAASIKLFAAGGYLWVLDTLGDEKIGYLFQLDPQTGETLNSLDLVGDEGRAMGDVPMDIATEGDNLWILTGRQLLRIKLP